MDPCPWRQANIAFPDWTAAEYTVVTRLAPLLATAEAESLIISWFFVRKAPCWRVRYRPGGDASQARAYLHHHLEDLKTSHHIEDFTQLVYEPETHAFGGVDGMAAAHRLFHLDSRHLLDHLAETSHRPASDHRREISILLCSTLQQAAGLDWYEQGDVWTRVADHREPPGHVPAGRLHTLQNGVRRLMSADAEGLVRDGASLAFAAGWVEVFATAGRELADLAAKGLLHRGLRAILAHHIIFAWNRHGLPHPTQAVLANTAKTVVFGPDPTTEDGSQNGDEPWTAPADR